MRMNMCLNLLRVCIDKIVIENEVEKESVIMCGDSEVDYLAAKKCRNRFY